jgi:hypothetical protein
MNNDEPIDGFSDVTENNASNLPDPPDPGVAQGTREPLSPEERAKMDREDEEFAQGSEDYPSTSDEADELESSMPNPGSGGGQRGETMGGSSDGGHGTGEAAGGVAMRDMGSQDDVTGGIGGSPDHADANTGSGISESGTGGGIDGIRNSGQGNHPLGESPTAGGASAGANTGGIGQGTTDFDEEG